jgi:hypothetical protein
VRAFLADQLERNKPASASVRYRALQAGMPAIPGKTQTAVGAEGLEPPTPCLHKPLNAVRRPGNPLIQAPPLNAVRMVRRSRESPIPKRALGLLGEAAP